MRRRWPDAYLLVRQLSGCVSPFRRDGARGDRAKIELMAPGGAPAKQLPPKPPDRGSFPLDHFRECSGSKKLYVDCLKEHDMQAEACRHLAGAYLQCRMDTCAASTSAHALLCGCGLNACARGREHLMAREELTRLGFHDGATQAPSGTASGSTAADRAKLATDSTQRDRAREGFIAGIPPPKGET